MISETEKTILKNYWRDQAKAWWNTEGSRSSGICDACSHRTVNRGEGYVIGGSSLKCEVCMEDTLDYYSDWDSPFIKGELAKAQNKY